MDPRGRKKIAELEAEIARLKAEAEEAPGRAEEMEQFAYVASHDLKEPLRIVANYLGLLKRRYGKNLDDRGVEYIETAIDATSRMRQLIDNLLEFGRVQLALREPVDLGMPLDVAVKNLGEAIAETGANIIADPLPIVSVDPNQMARLLQNLIGNAIKYRSSEAPQIRITAEHLDNAWRIRVTDNGMGIPEEHRHKVFAMFSRLHGSDEIDGSGIGLATCKRIVERHGGTIGMEPNSGSGSTFYFTLPEEPAAAQSA